jgi:hypothetical protein
MSRNFSFCISAIAGLLVGCSGSNRTAVLDWTNASASGDSVAAAFTKVLGNAPDSLQKCSSKRVRLSFVNQPGAFPISNQTNGSTTLQSGPSTFVDRNVVRSIAYASTDELASFGIDTLVVTLTRSARNGGMQRSTYEISVSDLRLANDILASYSAPVASISLIEQPCASTRH